MNESLKDNKQQRGYLTIYIPFKTKLVEIKCDEGMRRIMPKTKLLISAVSKTLRENVATYCLYCAKQSGEEIDELDKLKNSESKFEIKDQIIEGDDEEYFELPKPESLENHQVKISDGAIKKIETIIKEHIGATNKKEETIITKEDVTVNVDDISFSIFNDRILDMNKTGIFKVRVKIQFLKNFDIKNKTQTIRDVYDVFSRNIKGKLDGLEDIAFHFNFNDLSNNIFNKLQIIFVDKKTYKLNINEEDWLFNYNKNDRRSYTFSYITHDDTINGFVDSGSESEAVVKDALYHLSRIHENGFVRTYNKQNNIYDFYKDDTSAVWGISRVGLGAICIQEEREEFYRNIDVLNNDFSSIFEFSLHQKFFNYLVANLEQDKNILFANSIIQKEGLAEYKSIFCPNVISEFETQEIYESIVKKLEINELLLDAEKNVEKLEIQQEKVKTRRFVLISFVTFGVLFPAALLAYIYSALEINGTFYGKFPGTTVAGRIVLFAFLGLIGSLVSILFYTLTGRTKEK